MSATAYSGLQDFSMKWCFSPSATRDYWLNWEPLNLECCSQRDELISNFLGLYDLKFVDVSLQAARRFAIKYMYLHQL